MTREKTRISTAVRRGYSNLGGRKEGWIIKKIKVAESRRQELKYLIKAAVTTRNLHRCCSRISHATTRCSQGAGPFAQVTGTNWSQDTTQKD